MSEWMTWLNLLAELPFGDMVYIMYALLDPSFCLFWLDQDVTAPVEVKSQVKEMIIGRYKYILFPNTVTSHYALNLD